MAESKVKPELGVVAHACHPRTEEAKAGGSLRSKPPCSTDPIHPNQMNEGTKKQMKISFLVSFFLRPPSKEGS